MKNKKKNLEKHKQNTYEKKEEQGELSSHEKFLSVNLKSVKVVDKQIKNSLIRTSSLGTSPSR